MLKIFYFHVPLVRKSLDNMLYHARQLAKEKENMELGDGEKYREVRDAPGVDERRSRIMDFQGIWRTLKQKNRRSRWNLFLKSMK